MAILAKIHHEIMRCTLQMWEDKAVNDDVFIAITRRKKERGHSMADFVDDPTSYP